MHLQANNRQNRAETGTHNRDVRVLLLLASMLLYHSFSLIETGAGDKETNLAVMHEDNVKSYFSFKPLNLNTATLEELMLLPGIGERYAEEIILYRSARGQFNNIEEIMNIPGIGIKTLNSLRPHIIL